MDGRNLRQITFRGEILAVVGLAALAGNFPVAARESVLRGPVAAEVVRVVDGDTLAVRARIWLDQQVEILVRLDGIDAPELRGACADERRRAGAARAGLERLVQDGDVSLLAVRHDKYGGRVRATVLDADGRDLAQALIAADLVRPYAGGARQSWCGGEGAP